MKFHYGYHHQMGGRVSEGKPPVADKSRIFKCSDDLKVVIQFLDYSGRTPAWGFDEQCIIKVLVLDDREAMVEVKPNIYCMPAQRKKATKHIEKAISRLKEITPDTVSAALSGVAAKYPMRSEITDPLPT